MNTIKTFTSVETFKKYKTLLFDSKFLNNSEGVLKIHSVSNNKLKSYSMIGEIAIGMAEYIFAIPYDEIEITPYRNRIREYVGRLSSISPSDTDEVKEILLDFFTEFENLIESAMEYASEPAIVYIAGENEDLNEEEIKRALYLNAYKSFVKYIEVKVPPGEYDSYVYTTPVGLFPISGKEYIFIKDFLNISSDEDKINIVKFMSTVDEDMRLETFDGRKYKKSNVSNNDSLSYSVLPYAQKEADIMYSMYEALHGNTHDHEVKPYDLDNYDPMKTLRRRVVDKETDKAITYDIKIHTLSEFEDLAIELRRLYKRDYPESIGMLETYLYSMNVEQLRDMLEKLS